MDGVRGGLRGAARSVGAIGGLDTGAAGTALTALTAGTRAASKAVGASLSWGSAALASGAGIAADAAGGVAAGWVSRFLQARHGGAG